MAFRKTDISAFLYQVSALIIVTPLMCRILVVAKYWISVRGGGTDISDIDWINNIGYRLEITDMPSLIIPKRRFSYPDHKIVAQYRSGRKVWKYWQILLKISQMPCLCLPIHLWQYLGVWHCNDISLTHGKHTYTCLMMFLCCHISDICIACIAGQSRFSTFIGYVRSYMDILISVTRFWFWPICDSDFDV